MSSSVVTYQHASLSSEDSIRVLDLLPSLCSKAPVEVRIREVSLSDPRIVKYEALSYARLGVDAKRKRGIVRGNSNKSSSVVVSCSGGRRLPVTDNCHAALVHLRRRLRTRTLWVDAVCIDQAEDEAGAKERNRQVQLMGRIYNRASRAVIWLGQGDKNMKLLFRAIRLWSVSAKAEKFFNRNDSICIEMGILLATLLLFSRLSFYIPSLFNANSWTQQRVLSLTNWLRGISRKGLCPAGLERSKPKPLVHEALDGARSRNGSYRNDHDQLFGTQLEYIHSHITRSRPWLFPTPHAAILGLRLHTTTHGTGSGREDIHRFRGVREGYKPYILGGIGKSSKF
ncbi:HET-domain-containing protein [Apiospora rasikravindrae]|uniref:HET-domain-containing protein n=1 Tax=Apiospora rasikravindrae TaxID=990691 RepID=A0ABR1U0Z9_9PEZI